MNPRSLIVVLFALSACSPPTVEVKDRKLSTTTSVGVDSTTLCDGAPFGKGSIDYAKDLKEAGVDLSQGCIKSGSFELVAEYSDVLPGASCTTPTGTVTLTGISLEADCTAGDPKQTLRTTCAANRLDVTDGTKVFVTINACLDEIERTQTEPLRQLINSCKPSKLTFVVEGSCSADLCFKAKLLFGVQTKNVVAQLGGTCP